MNVIYLKQQMDGGKEKKIVKKIMKKNEQV
jgi:hypothetical protein